jgi:hypothetical protein
VYVVGESGVGVYHNPPEIWSSTKFDCTSLGKYADAESFYKRALVIDKETLGSRHQDVAASLNNLVNDLKSQMML